MSGVAMLAVATMALGAAPKLLTYREEKAIKTNFTVARGIAIAGGLVYVAGDRAVRVYTLSGQRQGGVAMPGEPQCLAVDKDGTAYVGVGNHVEVIRGTKRTEWAAASPDAIITCVSVGKNGVWVADSAGRRILRYRRDGTLLAVLCRKTKGYKGLVVPSAHLDVAEGRGGLVWVANPGMHLLEAHAISGALKGQWGKESQDSDGFSGCCNPTDFALFADGRFVTAEKGIPRVKVYSPKGVLLAVVAGPAAFDYKAAGLDVAVWGERVLVLDPKSRSVRVFSPMKGGRR
jgi:hypothetical protein